MSFSEEYEKKSFAPRPTSGVQYVKLTEEYRTTVRILDHNARTVWKHYVPQANKGGGGSVVCPNTTSQTQACPIEASVAHLKRDDDDRKAANARRKFVVNVLDRTPYTTCPACNERTPGVSGGPTRSKKCANCKADLPKDCEFKPLNKVKVLEGGPRLFNEGLNAIERMQKEELGLDITQYDITFTTTGKGRDKKTTALPRDPEPLPADALIDPETNEPQKLFNLDELTVPDSIEVINAMLAGETYEVINALRNPLPF